MQHVNYSAADVSISNPKLGVGSSPAQDLRIFPYYAGYSSSFAREALLSLPLEPGASVFDPWNGSGTTTKVAHHLGHNAIGIDLNPAMVIAAKAAMLSSLDVPSLLPIAQSLVENNFPQDQLDRDPLLQWLCPDSAHSVRSLESAINHTLICNGTYIKLNDNEALDKVSPLAAFFYVALFRTVRRLLVEFIPSNPTWVKKPRSLSHRKRPGKQKIQMSFIAEVERLLGATCTHNTETTASVNKIVLKIGNAENAPLPDKSVDAVISSPPYCTRIDYAVSTSIELSVLRLDEKEFDLLRRTLTGTSTVNIKEAKADPSWGATCIRFLEKLHAHPSSASRGYYYKNHIQYFNSLSLSIAELSRVLKPHAYCILVLQDSYYKEIHNDVPGVAVDMASTNGLQLARRLDFTSSRSMVHINGRSRKYLDNRTTTESVLIFKRDN
jgi:DNA modification methylase